MTDLHGRGIRTIVDLTTVDLGRDIDLIVGVAAPLARARDRGHRRLVDAAALLQRARRGRRWPRSSSATSPQGIGTSGVKAAIIKCATDTAGVTAGDREHPARLRAGPEGDRGADLHAHLGGGPHRRGRSRRSSPRRASISAASSSATAATARTCGYLRGLMERGSTIGMDRFGLEHFLPTEKRVEVLAKLCAEGYAAKMVLSHDANCWSDMLSEDDKRRTPAALALQPHLRRHPARAPQGGRHRGPDRADARAQPARDLRGAEAGEGMMLPITLTCADYARDHAARHRRGEAREDRAHHGAGQPRLVAGARRHDQSRRVRTRPCRAASGRWPSTSIASTRATTASSACRCSRCGTSPRATSTCATAARCGRPPTWPASASACTAGAPAAPSGIATSCATSGLDPATIEWWVGDIDTPWSAQPMDAAGLPAGLTHAAGRPLAVGHARSRASSRRSTARRVPQRYHPEAGPIARLFPDFRADRDRSTSARPAPFRPSTSSCCGARRGRPTGGSPRASPTPSSPPMTASPRRSRASPTRRRGSRRSSRSTDAVMGEDFHPYGYERNRTQIEMFAGEAFKLGLTSRLVTPEEYFADYPEGGLRRWPIVLGTGAHRYEVVERLGQAAAGAGVQRRRRRGRRGRAGPRLRVQPRRASDGRSSTATATSCARGARACSPRARRPHGARRHALAHRRRRPHRPPLHARRQGAADARHPGEAHGLHERRALSPLHPYRAVPEGRALRVGRLRQCARPQVLARREAPALVGRARHRSRPVQYPPQHLPATRMAGSTWRIARTTASRSSTATGGTRPSGTTCTGPRDSTCGPADRRASTWARSAAGWRSTRTCRTSGPASASTRAKGELLARLGDRPAGLEPGQFVSPHGLAVDSRGDIYVGEVSYTNWGRRGPDPARSAQPAEAREGTLRRKEAPMTEPVTMLIFSDYV